MYDMILQKKKELQGCMPDNPEFHTWLEESDIWCWAYSLLRVQGQRISKDIVVATQAAELRDDIPLSLYAFVGSCKSVYFDMKTSIAMGDRLDLKMLNRWAGMLLDKSSAEPEKTLYRTNNPVIYEWELIPVHFRELRDELSAVLRTAAQAKDMEDPLDAAAYAHLEIDRLYPYGEDTVAVSFAALVYMLLKLGLPVPELSVGDIEYNKMIAKYAEDRSRSDFKGMLERSVFNRVDAVLGLAKQAAESVE